MKTNPRLIVSLIKRIEVRLPINSSGKSIELLEQDPITQQTAAAIIELSIHKLAIIVNQLALVLDSISKIYSQSTMDLSAPSELLQSQLFILRLLSACLQHHWLEYHKQVTQQQAVEGEVTSVSIGSSAATADMHSNTIQHQGTRSSSLANNTTTNVKQQFVNPEPLDETLVAFLLSLISRFLTPIHIIEESKEQLVGSSSSVAPDHGGEKGASTTQSPTKLLDSQTIDYIHEIYSTAGKILFYTSASNWNTYYARIRNAVNILAAINDNVESNPPDIRILAFASLDIPRLHTVLSDLSPYFLNMRTQGKLLFAKVIRSAIWKWIETKPSQFAEIYAKTGGESNKPIITGIEILFDMCNNAADSSRKRSVLWPLQTILLALTPEHLVQAFLDDHGLQNRRTAFPRQLKKALQSSRTQDIAAICYIDLCKAAVYMPPNEDNILRLIAADVADTLQEKVWDFSRVSAIDSLSFGLGYTISHLSLLTDYFSTAVKLNTAKALKCLIPPLLKEDEEIPTVFKQAFVNSCLSIALDENSSLTWCPTLKSMYSYISAPLRRIFIHAAKVVLNPSALFRSEISNSLFTTNRKQNGVTTAASSGTMAAMVVPVATNSEKSLQPPQQMATLLQSMLKLFRLDPASALMGNNHDEDDDGHMRVDENAAMISSMINLMKYHERRIRRSAASCIVQFFDMEYIKQWGPSETLISNFWKISSQTVLHLARQILDQRQTEEHLKSYLELLSKILISRNIFLRSLADTGNENTISHERVQSSVTVETALLVSLCSPIPDICSLANKCLGHLCIEAKLVEEDILLVDTASRTSQTIGGFGHNLEIYEDLSYEESVSHQQGAKKQPFIGRKAQQKKVRKYLRMINAPTPGVLSAWEEVWKRWKILTQVVSRFGVDSLRELMNESVSSTTSTMSSTSTSSVKKIGGLVRHDKVKSSSVRTIATPPVPVSRIETDDEKQTEWQNYTGFLAALGGSRLAADLIDEELFEDKRSPKASSDNIKMASSTRLPPASNTMIDKFVSEMIELLTSENVMVREGAKDTLGGDISPALYAILFRHLENAMSNCFSSKGDVICDSTNTLLVEQTVLILKMILDRLTDPNDCLLSTDFGTLILQLANYINRLPRENYTTMRTMIMMCHLTEVLMLKKEQVIIRDDVRVRNKLLEIILEWTSDFTLRVMKNGSTKMSFSSSQNQEVQRDLDQVCLKAIVTILHKLPLQAVDQSRETDRTMSKTRLFQKYFTYFTQLLDRCHRYEKESTTLVAKSTSNLLGKTGRELQTLMSKPSELYQYWGPLKDSAVNAISNLLNANVDCGLQFALAMGYHEDSRTRTAFMQVLSNILNQGAQFDTLAENIIANRYEKLVEIIVDSDIDVALALCDVCPSTEATVISKVLLQCFESRSRVLTLLKAIISREVSSTEQESTLFRGTNMATRILSIFARETCVDYIRFTLQPAMELINGLPDENLTWELDPQKVPSKEDILLNKQNVCRATEIFLDAICNSTENAPRLFRQELALIVEAVNKRFPDASKTAVGGFVFLRLFNPAILTPENSGFSKAALPRSKLVKKLLLQATRMMQNLANNIMFGAKEMHLISLNDFITSNLYRVANFLREISTVPETGDRCIKEEARGIRMDSFAFTKLHCYMSDNLDKISRNLSVRRASSNADTQKLLEWKRTMDKLSNLLAQLVPPNELAQHEFNTARNYALLTSNNNFYSEFIRRNKHRDLSYISSLNIFYKGGNSKGGRPVFYMITRNVVGESFDFELLVYYMLRVMEPYLNHPFELLFDLSRFSEDVEIPIHWLNQFFQLIFSEMNDYLVTLILYNPNFHMQRYVRKLPRVITNKLVKRTRFAITLDQLTKYIAIPDIQLPKETLEMEKVKGMTISNAFIVTSFKVMIPVNIKVGQEYLIVTTLREQEIFWSLNAVLNNILSMTDITDIFMPTMPKKASNEGEIHIVHDTGKATMILIVPNCEEIYKYLVERKNNFESNLTNVNHHGIRPTDVPGRILNMALLNMASNDPALRTEAHNLLCSLCISFRFGCDHKLMKTKDICIPSNSVDFIVNISENLANTEAHLTLEFLNECILGFNRSSKEITRQLITLEYMVPWLKNLALYNTASLQARDVSKVKDVIRLLIIMTAEKSQVYQHIQKKVWNTLKDIDELHGLILDALVQYSVENGIASPQAEAMADTIVTMNTHTIRGKVLRRMRRVLAATSQHCRPFLTKHPLWNEIGCLIRFMLMLSFYSDSILQHNLAEIFHIIALLVATGPTFIRSSMHEFVVNVIHALVTNKHITAGDRKKLKYILDDVCDGKYRVHFGLNKSYANAFTITEETMTDDAENMNLSSLEIIVRLLIDAIYYAAPTADMANMWRARWMSLVTSMTFQYNPALQPRAFVILGCLAQEDIDDDLLFQILVVLRNELARFDEKNPYLVISILMCLTNIIDNLTESSRYLKPIFWLAVAMVEMNHSQIFSHAVKLLHAELRTLDTHKCFQSGSIQEVLMDARLSYASIFQRIDKAAGLSFDTQFSFAIAAALLKGYRYSDARETIFTCLTTFLEIETKSLTLATGHNASASHLLLSHPPAHHHSNVHNRVDVKCLGYLCGLLPFAAKNDALKELLRLAGVNEDIIDMSNGSVLDQPLSNISNISAGNGLSHDIVSIGGVTTTPAPPQSIYNIIWRAIDIPNNTTGVLLVSFLVGLLSLAENEPERLFLYGFLSRAAVSTPEVFAIIYDSLIPKMNSIVVSSDNPTLISAVKDILMTVCSEPAFRSERLGQQHVYLEQIGFSALGEVNFGALSTLTTVNAGLASELLSMICE